MHSTLMRWMRAAGILIMLLGLFGCTGVPVREEEQQPPYQEIQDCIEAGNPECALRKYRDYLKTFPDAAIDRLLIARLLVAAYRPEEAREELELLIAESGPTVETLLTLGHLERLAGEPDRERQALERALEIEEGNARVLAALGTLQVEAGEHDRARQSFDKALEADPREPTALRGLAVSCLEQQRYQEAVDYFDRAVDADPGNPLNYSDRARGRAALKDRQGAVQDLSTAIAMDP
ncbi:MAG: tetratricopeptide repeat protein, partial [Spirochaetales bacterium]|nr:tetratricopeptide repeat protein [Spirochaetales bacterium]